MKKLITLILLLSVNTIVALAQSTKYNVIWAQLDSLDKLDLPLEARQVVDSLYPIIKQEQDWMAFAKLVIYKQRYIGALDENGLEKAVIGFEKEAYVAASPVREFLLSMAASAYTDYARRKQYKFESRTPTDSSFQQTDISTWSLLQFHNKIAALYNASVKNTANLSVSLNDFAALLSDAEITAPYLRNLYDFLAWRAIDFFMENPINPPKPFVYFDLDNKVVFADAQQFINYEFSTLDTTSSLYQGVKLLQRVTQVHLKDEDVTALRYIDYRRIALMDEKVTLYNKEEYYIEAIKREMNTTLNHPIYVEWSYLLALHHYGLANYYDDIYGLAYKEEKAKAYQIVDNAEKKFSQAFTVSYCKDMKDNILLPEYRVEVENACPLNEPILARVDYRNLSKLYAYLVPVNREDADYYKSYYRSSDWRTVDTANIKDLLALPNGTSWVIDLKDDKDYNWHSTDIKINPVTKAGYYILLISNNDKFSFKDDGNIDLLGFYASQIACIKRDYDHGLDVYFVDRKSGQPVPNIKANVFQYHRPKKDTTYTKAILKALYTNEDGYLRLSYDSINSHVDFFDENDSLLYLPLDEMTVSSRPDVSTNEQTILLFLDRNIYRPGQIIYFKGIAMAYDKFHHRCHILPNQRYKVELLNIMSSQYVDSVWVQTNEYGAFSGQFQLPVNNANGYWMIRTEYASRNVSVEDYKRPKFEVLVDEPPLIKDFSRPVLITGRAQSFAGNVIDGAKVGYRITCNMFGSYYRAKEEDDDNNYGGIEVAKGEVLTDSKGLFTLRFLPAADPKQFRYNPIYQYRIYITVTDISGETRGAETSVRVNKDGMIVDVFPNKVMDCHALKSFDLEINDLNGKPLATKGTLRVEKLREPSVVFQEKLWASSSAAYNVMDAETFKVAFPMMAYGEEANPDKWESERLMFKTNYSTTKTHKVQIPNRIKFSAGVYKVTVLAQNPSGRMRTIVKYLYLYDAQAHKTPANQPLFAELDKESYEPGDTAKLYIGSSHEASMVLLEIEHEDSIIHRRWVDLSNQSVVNLPIIDAYRGNFHLHLCLMKNWRIYQKEMTVPVSWKSKDLNIEYLTFRDKLLPNQDEEWTLKISDNKGKPVVAEVLASLYDASLDELKGVGIPRWQQYIYGTDYPDYPLRFTSYLGTYVEGISESYFDVYYGWRYSYPELKWFGYLDYKYETRNRYANRTYVYLNSKNVLVVESNRRPIIMGNNTQGLILGSEEELDTLSKPKNKVLSFDEIEARRNLKETVFFQPSLISDATGQVQIKFKMNEALTRWKFRVYAHTKDLKVAYAERMVQTQKALSIEPFVPRFVRDNDKIEFTAKVSSLTNTKMTGEAKLELFDALTMRPIDSLLGNTKAIVSFDVKAMQSTRLTWVLNIPDIGLNAISYRVVAKSGNYTDGEINTLPVVTNRMLVTETMPLPIRGGQTKDFEFKRMSEVSKSSTVKQHKLTLEFTANPAWYAVQALPYLMEYPYECTEQLFNRFYANALATTVANSHPKIKQVFDTWKNLEPEALESNLAKSQDLKQALLEETPWVLAAESEEMQKKNIALLFDLNRMSAEQQSVVGQLASRQLPSGGFSWFPDMPENRYITQYLIEGMGHLMNLGVKLNRNDKICQIIKSAIRCCDKLLVDDYIKDLNDSTKLERYGLIHYLYARSFYIEQNKSALFVPLDGIVAPAYEYYFNQAQASWAKYSYYSKGLLALVANRYGKTELAQDIVKSLRQNALNNEEFGMYWKYPSGYSWYQMPIETHALMIEVFDEVANDAQAVDDLKTYLIKNKQTTAWSTTKATASATYALLLRGDNWLAEDKDINITLGNTLLDQSKIKKEAGTGYFKTTWEPADIKPEMAKVKIENPNKNVAWGAMYWQYFEQLDKITFFKETPLKLNKQLFRQDITDKGPLLTPIDEKTELHIGDLVKVRIELFVDRDMEYVQLKDMRASCFEPTNVLSQYKYQGGLGYYESTRDLSTSFFIGYLSKGSYVFEYPLRVTHRGNFSNGVTTIQCMYAPEFTSHSSGIRVQVK